MTDEDDVSRLVRTFSVHSAESQEKAQQIFQYLREKCPVARSEAHGGFWILSRYSDIYEAEHRSAPLFTSFPVTIPPFGNPVPMIPLEVDSPEHARYRRVVGKKFSVASVSQVESQIRKIAEELFANLAGRGEVDLVKELAEPLPLRVLLDVYMQIPKSDQGALVAKFTQMLSPGTGIDDDSIASSRLAAGLECRTYLDKLLRLRRENPGGGDLITFLGRDEHGLTDDEILGFLLLLIPAGYDTTASTLGQIFLYLVEHPSDRDRLVEEPDGIRIAVEEFLRYTSAVTGQARTAKETCEFANTQLRQDDRVVLLWAAANRDPEMFAEPEEVVITRSPNPHLAFGSGPHRCLGSHLARTQLRVMIEEYVNRMPAAVLDPDRAPVWRPGETWGLTSLPVRLT